MTAYEPLFDELRAMFAHDEGPATPLPVPRRSRAPRRLVLTIGIAVLLAGASVASAGPVLDLFGGGQPVSQKVKDQIAAGSQGAPAGLDPGIESDKAVTMITLATAKGTVSLIASPATKADYCMGLQLSWLKGGAGLGCNGPRAPGTPLRPIDVGQAIPGIVGRSPIFVYGRVNDKAAASARLKLSDGSHVDLALTSGYFLAELAATQQLRRVDAIDAAGAIVDREDVPPIPDHIP